MGPAGALRLGWAYEPISKRRTAAFLDHLTHDTQSFERNGERYRFRESMKTKEGRKAE
jgi:hypothetical protein